MSRFGRVFEAYRSYRPLFVSHSVGLPRLVQAQDGGYSPSRGA
jgi:hypothetical protein